MGPRPIGRGNPARAAPNEKSAPLQWGRDQLVAEISGVEAEVSLAAVLQWGRDQLVAEMVPTGRM